MEKERKNVLLNMVGLNHDDMTTQKDNSARVVVFLPTKSGSDFRARNKTPIKFVFCAFNFVRYDASGEMEWIMRL